MKIEKINENKIKFLLTNEDLQEREIKLSELAKGTEKAQAFFRDIMTEALEDFGFDVSDSPLMIEAMPIAIDGIIIIVSKVTNETSTEDTNISLTPKTLERKFKQSGIKVIKNKISQKESIEDNMSIYIYSFDTLDDVIKLSTRLVSDLDKISSILYKHKDRYFLTIKEPFSIENRLDYTLAEYGQKHSASVISKFYLDEHGEQIISKNALNILATL